MAGAMERTKIDAEKLAVGMYVSQLDRPWLETPFLFQGFEIRDEADIAQLRAHCRHVYVDITRSSLTADEIKQKINRQKYNDTSIFHQTDERPPQPGIGFRLIRTLGRLDPTGKLANRFDGSRNYRVKTSLKKELPQAGDAYNTARAAINSVLEQVRAGHVVDVDQVRHAVDPVIHSVLRNPSAMPWFVLLQKHDSYAYHHSIATSVWAAVLGRHLGFDVQALETLTMGAMLLDIGKAKIPELLLNKHPLQDGDMDILRQHVLVGLEIAEQTPGIPHEALDMIATHHERLDGSGYPYGLSGSDIPVYGRIAGLVDCYDAMTTSRPYAQGMSSYNAIRELNSLAGKHFQKELVEQFVQALGMFPAGSIVELNNGEVGIVIEANPIRRLRPKIMLLLDADKKPFGRRRQIDLHKIPADIRDKRARWITVGHEFGAFGIDPAQHLAA